jgi:hypothetical protein
MAKTQKTKQGAEIPIQKRGDFFGKSKGSRRAREEIT